MRRVRAMSEQAAAIIGRNKAMLRADAAAPPRRCPELAALQFFPVAAPPRFALVQRACRVSLATAGMFIGPAAWPVRTPRRMIR